MNTQSKFYNLLKWSEKWTHTDMVYLAKGGFWLTFGKIFGILSSFILSIIYANYLAKDDYGTYKYILSMAALLSIPTLMGMNDSIIRSVSLGFEGSVFKAIKTKFKWGVTGGLAGLIISAYYFYSGNIVLAGGFLIISIYTPLVDGLVVHGAYLSGKKLFKQNAIINLIFKIVLTSAIVLSMIFYKNIILFILIYFLVSFILQFSFTFYTYKKYKPNNKVDPQTISFGKHLSLMGILGILTGQADKFLLWHFLGAQSLAIYAFAISPVEQFRSLLKSFSPLAMPKLAIQNKDVLKKSLPPKIFKFILLLLIPIAIYIIIAPYFFKLVYPEYTDSIKYSLIYVFSLLFYPQTLLSTVFTAKAKKTILYILSVSNPLIKLVYIFIFTYYFGIYGLIFGQLLSMATQGILNYYFFKKL